MRKLTHEEIVSRQVQGLNKPKLPFCAVINNIRSLHNVGAMFRTADGVGMEKLYLCGFTGYPPQSGITKIALGAENHVPWEYHKSSLECIKDLKAKGYQIVFLEQMEGSISHDQFVPKGPVCLVVGNEVSGVAEDILSLCDCAVEIDMAGIKNSLNVGVAFGIIAYHIRSNLKMLRT